MLDVDQQKETHKMDKMTSKNINQKQGPRTGNKGTPSKREAFLNAKESSSSDKVYLVKMVTDALESRGRFTASKTQPAFEGLHPNTNVGRGPTKGNGGKPNKRASGAPR